MSEQNNESVRTEQGEYQKRTRRVSEKRVSEQNKEIVRREQGEC